MKLVERMPRVCKAVIKAKGGYLNNLKYKIHFDLFNPFLVLHDSICVISLKIVKIKKNPRMNMCSKTVDR